MADTLFKILPRYCWHITIKSTFYSEAYFKVQKISAKWIPHLLTYEQKRVCVQMAKQFAKKSHNSTNSTIQPKAILSTFLLETRLGSQQGKYETRYGLPNKLDNPLFSCQKEGGHKEGPLCYYIALFISSCDHIAMQVQIPKG